MTANRRRQWDEGAAVALHLIPVADPRDAVWQDFAACAEADGDSFYPPKGGSNEVAKRVCARCPVTQQCLSYALDHMGTCDPIRDVGNWGIWGGTSAEQRRRIKQQRERDAA